MTSRRAIRSSNTGMFPLYRWQMLGILLFGFAVQTHNLTGLVLWSDEAWTITATDSGDPARMIDDWLAEDVHPPLFFFELSIWRGLTGDTILGMRYFSVLLILVGVALVYRLGRELFSPQAGMLAALLFTLHDLVHVFAQEVRHYPQQITLTALVMWLYWRFWRRPTRGRGVVFAVAGAALLWSHYWGGFVLLALGCHALITRRRALAPFALAYVGIGVMFTPWLPVLYEQVMFEGREGLPHALGNSWTSYKTLAFQLAGTPEVFWIILAAVGVLGVFVAAPVRRWRPTASSGLPALVVALTVGLTILLNARYPVLSPRPLAVVIPALLVLIAHTLAQFRRYEQAVVLGFVIIYSLGTTSAAPPVHPPWPDAADFLARHTTADDLILLELNNRELSRMEEVTLAYYLDHAGAAVQHISTEGARLEDEAGFPAYLDQALAGVSGVWVAKLGWWYYDIRPDLVQRGYVSTAPVVAWDPFIGLPIELWRYDRPPEDEPRAVFDDLLRLERTSVTASGDRVVVNLLWQPAQAPGRDYTVSTFLLDAGGVLVSQQDGYPFENRSPTHDWEAGGLYFDGHTLPTGALLPGDYRVGVKVYFFTDDFQTLTIALASDCSANPACEFIIIDSVHVD